MSQEISTLSMHNSYINIKNRSTEDIEVSLYEMIANGGKSELLPVSVPSSKIQPGSKGKEFRMNSEPFRVNWIYLNIQ